MKFPGPTLKSISFRCGVCQDFTVWYYDPAKVTNAELLAWRDKNVREHLACDEVEDDEEEPMYCLGGPDHDGVTVEQAMEGHEEHDVVHCTAGAPGVGNSIYCQTCKKQLWSNIRVLEPWEVM